MGGDDDSGKNGQDEARIRRRRNIAVGLILGAVVILFFLMTMVRIRSQYGS